MPQEKKLFDEETVKGLMGTACAIMVGSPSIEQAKKECEDELAATPAYLTIPETEVDAEQIIESDERLRHILFGHPDGYSVEGVIKSMHEFSDLRLAKAMEGEKTEAIEIVAWLSKNVGKEFGRKNGKLLHVNGKFFWSNTLDNASADELYQLFLADKKKGEGNK